MKRIYDEDLCPVCLLGYHAATHDRETKCPGREPMVAAANRYHYNRMTYLTGATRTAMGVLNVASNKLLEEADWELTHVASAGPAWWYKEPFGTCPQPEAVRHTIRAWEREKQALKRIEDDVGVAVKLPASPCPNPEPCEDHPRAGVKLAPKIVDGETVSFDVAEA